VPQLGAAALPATSPKVTQGFLESSNVNPTQEMVNMEMVSRAYQNSLRLLKTVEDVEERAIRSLGTVN
jgi:flagellar basal-body rod protein FlgF